MHDLADYYLYTFSYCFHCLEFWNSKWFPWNWLVVFLGAKNLLLSLTEEVQVLNRFRYYCQFQVRQWRLVWFLHPFPRLEILNVLQMTIQLSKWTPPTFQFSRWRRRRQDIFLNFSQNFTSTVSPNVDSSPDNTIALLIHQIVTWVGSHERLISSYRVGNESEAQNGATASYVRIICMLVVCSTNE